MLLGICHQRTGVQADNPRTARGHGQCQHVGWQGSKLHCIRKAIQWRVAQRGQHAALCRHLFATSNGHAHIKRGQIVNQHAVGIKAGGNGPLAVQALGLGGIERAQAHCGNGVHAQGHSLAQHFVHVPCGEQL